MKESAHLLISQAVLPLNATSTVLAELKNRILRIARSLPEYPVVEQLYGVGPALGPQLIAEIADVRRFYFKKALVTFASIDSPPNDSGQTKERNEKVKAIEAKAKSKAG